MFSTTTQINVKEGLKRTGKKSNINDYTAKKEEIT
jgi:hypothetical protein